MRADIASLKSSIEQSAQLLRRRLDWDTAEKRLDELNARAEDPALWDDPQQAQSLMRERNRLEAAMTDVREIEASLEETLEIAEMAEAEGDGGLIDEAAASLKLLADRAGKAELQALLGGEADANDAYVEIHPGAGGTEAQDWASMLTRMYSRWAQAAGFKVEVIEEQAGEEAGLKSATLLVKGENASTGSCASRPMTAQGAGTRALQASGSIRRSTIPSRSTFQKARCGWTPTGHRAPAASTSTRPTAPYA